MKRFLVFKGDNYYPQGGMNDFYLDCDTLEESILTVTLCDDYDTWIHIYDTESRTIVWENL
jgi:hypothetical protein